MQTRSRTTVHGLLTLIGIFLMVSGAALRRPGAVVIGMVVAGVNAQLWLRARNNVG